MQQEFVGREVKKVAAPYKKPPKALFKDLGKVFKIVLRHYQKCESISLTMCIV